MSLQLSGLAASFLESVGRFGYTTVAIVRMNENRSEPVYIVAQNSINARILTFCAGIIFFILAHHVYKMLIIQEPNTLEL